jgi:hypothetical protein
MQRPRVFDAENPDAAVCITRFDTDGWGAYERHHDAIKHRVGKDQTQKYEPTYHSSESHEASGASHALLFKTERRHDLVIGLFINR